MRRFKSGTLAARGRKNHDDDGPGIVYWYPRKVDGNLLHYTIGVDRYDGFNKLAPSFLKELEKRGYDLTTLEFTIRLKEDENP
jgi:hypothetical protein